jgi:glutamate N-acetyltransferase/amino-acid N-acetyltransferase
MSKIRHITLPAGFVAAGVKAGIKASGKEDLAIIAGVEDCAAAVLTTQNQVIGEPVRYIRNTLPKGYGVIRGIVVNAGCSNVCTGKAGYRDAVTMAADTAAFLGAKADRVLVASTGIIGHRLPIEKVCDGIKEAAKLLGTDNDTQTIRAMMTTDTREKTAVVQGRIGGKTVTVAGIVKGAGMIAPSAATMISVITTDAAIAPAALHQALRHVVGGTFNAITIDSDTSTSDTILVLASGKAGNKIITVTTERPLPSGREQRRPLPSGRGSPDYCKFAALLAEVCGVLARAVVADGEGATKVVDIAVRGARTDAEAAVAAKSVANSPLFKCAVHGGDPNWGRIAAALGKSSAKIDQAKLSISIGGVKVFSKGTGANFDLKKVQQHLAGKEIKVLCELGLGKGQFTAVTCDLSREYITINADYHT